MTEVRPGPTASLTTTTDEQRAAAIQWLDRTGPYAHWAPFTHDSAEHRDTIKAMLAEPSQGTSDPVLPAHPTPGSLKAMNEALWQAGIGFGVDDMQAVYTALHAHLSFKPGKTKTVYVVAAHWDGFKPSQWRDCSTTEEAGRHAAAFAKDGGLVTITPEQRP